MNKYRNIIILFITLSSINFMTGYLLYTYGVKYYKNVINDKLETSVLSFDMLLDPILLEKLIITPNQDNNTLYNQTIEKLEKAHKKAKNIKYVYTLHKKSNKILFGLDTAPRLVANKDGLPDHSDLNSPYDEVPSAALKAFATSETTISDKPYSDKWGTFIGVFKPVFKDNKIISLLCVEVDYSYYQATILKFRNYIMAISIVFLVFTIVLINFIYTSEKNKILAAHKEIEFSNQEMMIHAEGKMADIGRMMAGINHEINNPLQIIKGFSDVGKKLMKREYSKDEMIKVFDRIDTSVKRVTDIIIFMKSLLQNEKNIKFENYPLNNMVQEVSSFTNFKIKEFDISLTMENITDELIYCKKISIQQVLINLLSNSIDVIRHLDSKWIKISYSEDSEFHYITITDSGNGISLENQEKIAKGYYTTKENGEGSGIGLLLSNKIMNLHKGSLTYVGKEHTAFRISINKNIV